MARDVLETARKLRRLTASPNAHEAALAQAMFEAYTTRHQLAVEDEPVRPQTAAEFSAWLRRVEEQRRTIDAQMAQVMAAVEASQADALRFEIKYLHQLQRAKQDEYLRQMPRQQQAEYRRQLEMLRQASRLKRRGRKAE